jgi:phosphohistidine swiveling domain-containing protein
LPEIEEHLAFWDAFDIEEASLEALRLHLDESWQRVNQIWTLHFKLGPLAYKAMNKFKEYYGELFEEKEDELAAFRLLEGLDNKTVEIGHALWNLSQGLAPDVAQTIATHAAAEVVPALKKTESGRAFLVDLEVYLAEYGQRSNHWSLSLPSWTENPTPVCKSLQDYLRSDSDPRLKCQALAAERERALAVLRERLQGYPQRARDEFEERLKQAQLGMLISEDHNFWIDFSATYKVRCVILALGQRLVEAGWIEAADDLFYLHLEEVRQLHGDQRVLVAERRQWLEQYRKVKPPPRLGVEPPPEKKAAGEEENPEPPADEPGVLRGQVGSPGTVRGRAWVVESVASFEGLNPGDIIVAQTTSPSWTPLFATLGGVVTEQGGVLSHCAVIAREYRIPAVLGVVDARGKIADGQLIELDGATRRSRRVRCWLF